ncbi:MAG TPA: translation initiation factor IF-1 [Bryobacteraceae bacterium]|nr:translation initiation factor IF-1 [Bryobacteraceae bacterium]
MIGRERTVEATVIEELPSALYRVELPGRRQALVHPVGAVKRNFVRLLPGDRVEVELSPHDGSRGRITRRVTGSDRT